jgi:LysM repeat protein
MKQLLFKMFIWCNTGLAAFAYGQGWDTGDDDWSGTTSAVPAPQEASPTSPPPAEQSEPPAPQDATYTIKRGDTLWDLAFTFLGDPFLWQRIWQVNSYIENPDLIYPGNGLQIPGRGNSAETAGAGLTSETNAALDSAAALKKEIVASPEYPGDVPIITTIQQKNILSRTFLATVPFLWSERDATGNIFPGNGVVNAPEIGRSWQLFSLLTFKPYSGVTYKEGDTIDIFSSLRLVRFTEKTCNLVRRAGRARVQKVQAKEISALLFEMSNPIIGKERVAPATSFPRYVIDTLVEPSAPVTASVFTRVEETESPYPFQMIILDKGKMQGVELGDVFGLYHREKKDSPARLSVIGTIGHINESSSTLMIVIMIDNRVSEGDQAVLLRRARFSGQE